MGFSVVEAFLEYLAVEGITHVFGVPGGYIHPFLKALYRHPQLTFVMSRHEEGAAFMADGYARASGRLGVVLTTAGPGATNAITGIACAQKDRSPVLIVTGNTATPTVGRGAWQDSTAVGVTEMLRHVTGMSEAVVHPANFLTQLNQALRVAHGVPKQAVHLSLPLDVSTARIERAPVPSTRVYDISRSSRLSADAAQIVAALDLIAASQRPVILIGAGGVEALVDHELRARFFELVSRLSIPVMTSPHAKGVFPESHPLSLGVHGLGGSRRSEAYLTSEQPDLLLVVGSSLNEWSSNRWNEALRLPTMIQVDIDSKILGRSFPVHLGIVADARSFLSELDTLASQRRFDASVLEERRACLDAFRARVPRVTDSAKTASDDRPLKPQRVMYELDSFLRHREARLFLDMGNCTGFFNHYVQLDPPSRVFAPYGFSSMGWACGAVIGAKAALPHVPCIAIVGDGAFLMNGVELQSAARHRIGAVYLVLNDGYYGTVHHGEISTSGDESRIDDDTYSLGTLDLPTFAESLGATAHPVDEPGQLAVALSTASDQADRDERPQVIVVRVDHREKPPFGGRYHSLEKKWESR
jgi:acetolactate synthase-1/2/3 large subunit